MTNRHKDAAAQRAQAREFEPGPRHGSCNHPSIMKRNPVSEAWKNLRTAYATGTAAEFEAARVRYDAELAAYRAARRNHVDV